MQKPLEGNPKRQAVDSIRGYLYQMWRSTFAWMELADDEALFLEGAEDFDLIKVDGDTVTQVKDIAQSGVLTLRSEHVLKAIDNFLEIRERNRRRKIRYKFLTTATIGREQGSHFQGDAGLKVWQSCQSSNASADADRAASLIREFLLSLAGLPARTREFLEGADPGSVRKHVIDPIEWVTEEPDIDAVREAVRLKAVAWCGRRGVNSTEAPRIVAALFQEITNVIARKTDRSLTYDRFIEICDQSTSVTVPRVQLEALISSAGLRSPESLMRLARAAGLELESLSLDTRPAACLASPPALAERLLQRPAVVGNVSSRFSGSGVLAITGSTGMGKSTVARMYAQADGATWLWLDCRARTPEQIREMLLQSTETIVGDPSTRDLILDDLDLSTDTRIFELQLSSLAFVLKTRRGRLLITSHQVIPQRLRLLLGVEHDHILVIPAMTESEINQFLEQEGLTDESLRATWSRVTWLRTSGHPQLVSARIQTLRLSGFPAPRREDIIETPLDIQQARAEARRFLASELSPASRDLLYRLSLTTAPLRYQRARAIGDVPPALSNPGDALDDLIGPWVEKLDGDYYRISPLVQGVGNDANGSDWSSRMHAGIARTMSTYREITPSEASSILFHAVMGGEVDVITRMAVGLVHAEPNVWVQLGPALDWFLHYTLPAGRSGDPRHFRLFALRMLQFRIASAARVETLPDLVKTIDSEFPPAASSEIMRGMRFVLLGQILVQLDAPLSINEAISRAIEMVGLQREISTSPEYGGATDLLDRAVSMDDSFPMFIIPRLKSLDDLRAFTFALDSLSRDAWIKLLSGFSIDESMAEYLLNAVWLTQLNSSEPRWRETISAIENLYGKMKELGNAGMGRASAIIGARILDENLDESDAALAMLDRIATDFPEGPAQMDARAKVHFNAGRYSDAFLIWNEALRTWTPSRFAGELAISFATRSASIAAANIGEWHAAHRLIRRAHEVLSTSGNDIYRLGLLADIAYSYWHRSEFRDAIHAFDIVLQNLRSLPNTADEPKSYYLHKMVGGVLTYLGSDLSATSRDASKELWFYGRCSHLDPSQKINELNPTPIDFSWMHLLSLEISVGEEVLDYEALRRMLEDSPYVLVRLRVSELQLRRGITRADLVDMISLVIKFMRAMAFAEQLKADGTVRIWEPDPENIVPNEPTTASLQMAIGTYCVVALTVLANRGLNASEYIRKWIAHARLAKLDESIFLWFDFLLGLSENGLQKSIATLQDNFRPSIDRALASIFVASSNGANPNDVMAAHITLLTNVLATIPRNLIPSMEGEMAEMVERDWRRLAGRRFQLRFPATTAPAIIAACDQHSAGWSKCAAILKAAECATLWSLPTGLIERLQG